MNLIVATDSKWGIGRNGKLLFRIPEDMHNFKKLTLDKIVIMGRVTLDSLPESKPLKNRTNIVLSRDRALAVEGVVVCGSIESLLDTVKGNEPDDVFVIGGQTVYEQLAGYCSRAYVTKIDANGDADKFFPNLDGMKNWKCVSESGGKSDNGLNFVFTTYINTDFPHS